MHLEQNQFKLTDRRNYIIYIKVQQVKSYRLSLSVNNTVPLPTLKNTNRP